MLLYTANLDGNKKVFPRDVCCASVRMIALETACRKIRIASFIQTKSSLQHRFLISCWYWLLYLYIMKFCFIFIFLSQIALFLALATYSGFPVVMQVSSVQLTFLQLQRETIPFILSGFRSLIWTFCCLKNSHLSTSLVFLSKEEQGKD